MSLADQEPNLGYFPMYFPMSTLTFRVVRDENVNNAVANDLQGASQELWRLERSSCLRKFKRNKKEYESANLASRECSV